jgi:glycosyltransferase involved in cell wall biosynthesis
MLRYVAVTVSNATPRRVVRMRILHLGFEDPRRPGSGGGSVRTHEVNRRLAARHDITVVTAKFPGWRDRTEDGVRYLHAGVEAGYVGSVASYFLALPWLARRLDYDLLVEDFGAPISSVLAPLWSKAPCVAMVQWLFAREMARKYHLPVHLVEWLGVRAHRRMIALSSDLAARLRAANPGAEIEVIPEGVDRQAFDTVAERRHAAVYLGRLDIHQKGLDCLLDAFAKAAPSTAATLVIAGDGPDREALVEGCRRLGIRQRVQFAGRVEGAAKYALLASARVVCMPSRYEAFGIVAVEALACATPVLAFDIDCLRQVVPADAGRLVPVGDVAAYAAALVELLDRPEACLAMGERGRRFARRFDWDEIADRQERAYLRAVARPAELPQA